MSFWEDGQPYLSFKVKFIAGPCVFGLNIYVLVGEASLGH